MRSSIDDMSVQFSTKELLCLFPADKAAQHTNRISFEFTIVSGVVAGLNFSL